MLPGLTPLRAQAPAAAPAPATAPEKDLRSMRAAFRLTLLNAILPEKRAHRDELRDLEKKLAEAHDYEGAMHAREERIALEQEITALEQEIPVLTTRSAGGHDLLPERIVFKPQDAALSGVQLEKDGSLSGWTSSQNTATWKLPSLPSGGYEVILKYRAGADEGGALSVREAFYFLRGKTGPTSGKITEANIGTLRVSDGSGSITLAADAAGKGDLMKLVSLELAPVNR